ncbi:hypothetical protein [Thiomonas delicata]|uniref:Uncharacterized protein n=1 Tax=Thiomonas delicata TaxID=364030 RepID=A0A238D8Q2_THIDL|nr:hypothetical protein [Thiomonas delicata]SBP89708.1 conserved hypothetical protein [Thiomonas delicata]
MVLSSGKSWDPTSQQFDYDPNDPRVQELFAQIEGLRLESRGQFKPERVQLRGAGHVVGPLKDGQGALIANDDGQGAITLLVSTPLEEHQSCFVRRHLGMPGESEHLYEVLRCHAGRRPGEVENRVWVAVLSAMSRYSS